MLKVLQNTKFVDLLPPNFKYDVDAIAAGEALDANFNDLIQKIDRAIVFTAIPQQNEATLDTLAPDLHVDFYDVSWSIAKKISVIQKAIEWHIYKGSPEVVEDVITVLYGNCKTKEWFEYAGDPYYFKVFVDVIDEPFDEQSISELLELIEKYKNKRSWLDRLIIYLTSYYQLNIGIINFSGITTNTYPYTITEVDQQYNINIGIINFSGITTITYPLMEE